MAVLVSPIDSLPQSGVLRLGHQKTQTEKKSVLGTGLFCCAQRILNGVQEMGVRTEWEI